MNIQPKNQARRAVIVSASSYTKGYRPSFCIDGRKETLWMTNGSFPHTLTLQLNHLPLIGMNCVGFYCWQGYTTNPRKVELQVAYLFSLRKIITRCVYRVSVKVRTVCCFDLLI